MLGRTSIRVPPTRLMMVMMFVSTTLRVNQVLLLGPDLGNMLIDSIDVVSDFLVPLFDLLELLLDHESVVDLQNLFVDEQGPCMRVELVVEVAFVAVGWEHGDAAVNEISLLLFHGIVDRGS